MARAAGRILVTLAGHQVDDEAMRLAVHGPSGGIVSLHELPDFIRLVAAENRRV